MSFPVCSRIIRSDDRLLNPFNSLLIMLDSLAYATLHSTGNMRDYYEKPFLSATSSLLRLQLNLPFRNALALAIAEQSPAHIHMSFVPIPNDQTYEDWVRDMEVARARGERSTTGLSAPIILLVCPIFVAFFEDYKQWLYETIGHPDTWPPAWRFARVIRNAASHRRKVKIDQPKELPVEWQGLVISHQDNGKTIIGEIGGLFLPDIIALMLEMSDTLDGLGCPD